MQRRTPDFADSFREGVRYRIEIAFIAQPLRPVIRLTLVRTAVSRIWSAVWHLRARHSVESDRPIDSRSRWDQGGEFPDR
jgi:hypothetical protein